jgi:hypothetical protein
MWWLLAIFSGFFLYGITRPRYTTVNNYVDQYTDVDCDGGGDSSDSYCEDSSTSYDSGDSYSGGSDD